MADYSWLAWGSAANASHASNDFRKICGINAICLTDNISEFSARINDEDQDEIFVNIIKIHEINQNDLVIVLSVGGGSLENNTSINLVKLLSMRSLNLQILVQLLENQNA